MEILFLITSSEIGGAQTWVKDQVRLFAGDYKVRLATNKPGYLTEGEENVHYIKNLDKWFGLFSLFSIWRIVRENNIKVVVASSANAGVVSRLLKFFIRVRVVYVSHGWSCIYSGSGLRKFFMISERLLSFLSDLIICVSQSDFDIATKKLGIKNRKLTVIRNSVFPRFNPNVHREVVGSEMRVLFLGRLAHPKRPDLLVQAIGNNTGFLIDIVGDGPLMGSVRECTNVKCVGAINNFSNFDDYDVFCLISDSEGLPMSALEAASAGLPLVLSNVGGCAELIDGNGVLVDNDSQSIREAFFILRDAYSKYRQEAIRRRLDFSLERQKELYRSAYTGFRGP